MENTIPSSADVRDRLAGLSRAQLVQLAEQTGTPFTTLLKIRRGETQDPKLETVRSIWSALVAIARPKRRPSKAEA